MSIFARNSKLVTANATADLGPGAHPRISIKGGRFTLVDAGGIKYPWPNLYMPVIIIGANPNKSKVYYEGPYDPDSGQPPTCYSDNGIGPSMNATTKQARSCAECPLGAWGSDTSQITGKPTKACQDKKKLALIVVGDTAQHVYELQIPPASLRNLNKYAGFVSSKTTPDGSRKADVSDVVTWLYFAQDQVGVLEMQEACWIDCVGPDGNLQMGTDGKPALSADGGEAIAARIDEITEGNLIDEIVGLNDKPWSPQALPAAAPVQQIEYRQANPAPVQQSPFAGPPGAAPQRAVEAFPQHQANAIMAPSSAMAQVVQPPAQARGGARPGAGRPRKSAKEEVIPPGSQIVSGPQQTVMPFQPQPAPQPSPEGIPPFLQRQPVSPGIQSAGPPPSSIQDAVKAAFALPTK